MRPRCSGAVSLSTRCNWITSARSSLSAPTSTPSCSTPTSSCTSSQCATSTGRRHTKRPRTARVSHGDSRRTQRQDLPPERIASSAGEAGPQIPARASERRPARNPILFGDTGKIRSQILLDPAHHLPMPNADEEVLARSEHRSPVGRRKPIVGSGDHWMHVRAAAQTLSTWWPPENLRRNVRDE